ncbi:hypothetical protein CCO03_15330 [Comamonas serinivorans]|uniref:histidinol-phosphate transaminase n=2 Tax=Comamonas serinivorans TaxID=1082851 RepID=A0A1Y0ETX5_9BURK|nr:hypothetical protein CCO03_15330 [Comamonas serinivorans]
MPTVAGVARNAGPTQALRQAAPPQPLAEGAFAQALAGALAQGLAEASAEVVAESSTDAESATRAHAKSPGQPVATVRGRAAEHPAAAELQARPEASASVSARHVHGGPDALGVARHDFSTNANACGPCPQAAEAVAQADASHYPDPEYASLIADLSSEIGVYPDRIILGASASECIARLTAAVASRAGPAAPPRVWVPRQAYGDYARAARAWQLPLASQPGQADLVWHCEPASPTGQGVPELAHLDATHPEQVWVLDAAYAPLRLDGHSSLSPARREQVWQLFTPNKALGLTGVRAAYLVAPRSALEVGSPAWQLAQRLRALAPSWPVGAHGVAMLKAWLQPEVQQWLQRSLDQLRRWRQMQNAMLQAMGWVLQPSDSPYGVARPPVVPSPAEGGVADAGASELAAMLAFMRARGVKLRDTTSMGLPGWVRLAVRPPADQEALRAAWHAFIAWRPSALAVST